MEDSLDEMIALLSERSLAFYFHLITLNMIIEENESNKMSKVNLKTLLLKTLAKVHNDIDLKNYYSDNKKYLDIYNLGLKNVHTKLKIIESFKEGLFVINLKSPKRFLATSVICEEILVENRN